MTQDLGDDAALRLLGVHDGIVRAALDDHDGREVKHTGDGIMAAFASVIRCRYRARSPSSAGWRRTTLFSRAQRVAVRIRPQRRRAGGARG